MTINDLTKEELLELLVRRGLNRLISAYDIKTTRWNTMKRRVKIMMEEAIEEMNLHRGPENWPAYKKGADKFNRAMALYAESDKFIE